jgi:hypothetical protein
LDSPSPLFPLPLSDFEYLMYSEDTPRYPMSFFMKTFLSGELQRDEFEQSVRDAQQRHPLSRAVIQPRPLGRHCWIERVDACIPIDWAETSGEAPLCQDAIDLRSELGIRIWVRPRGEQTEVTYEFHHACCDGIGAAQFIGDLLAFYGQRTAVPDQPQPRLHELSDELLRRRGELFERSRDQPRGQRSLGKVIRKFRRLVGRKTMLLAAPEEPPADPIDRSIIRTKTLSREAFRGIRQVAKQTGSSLNDLLLREMFLTLRDWNRQHGALISREWLRIGMPVSMRPPRFGALPCCNMVSFMFLPRRPEACEDEQQLLESICEQTTRTLNQRLGNWLLTAIHWIRKIPGLMSWAIRRQRRFATAVLANVGEVHKHFTATFPMERGKCLAGSVRLERIGGVAPVRDGTRMAVTAIIYANELSLNMNCDQHRFSRAGAARLLEDYAGRLETLAATQAPSREERPVSDPTS